MFKKETVLNGKVAVVGLGYVGLPLAVAFADKGETIGFDVNAAKLDKYLHGIDPTEEIGDEKIQATSLKFTCDPTSLKQANFIVVAVPTPVNSDNTPDLSPVEGASKIVGQNLSPNTVVVFESTVWPGVTEDICVPILEHYSGLKCGTDFKVAYSPERINPGDKVHRLQTIKKIVSGMDEETLELVAEMYSRIIDVGVYKAQSIKVAEAAKLVENAQRDINIAFMNELAIAFDKMGIRTKDVIDAMNTKWNALGFVPGLVGGHCIGVDPYYFIYKAEMTGYHSQIIAAGRLINNSMGKFVADKLIKQMVLLDKLMLEANIYIFGITFKENCPDIRNSKVLDIIQRLKEYGLNIKIVDPWADKEEVKKFYGVDLVPLNEVKDADCVAVCVAHKEFAALSSKDMKGFFKAEGKHIIMDVKSILKSEDFPAERFAYLSL